MKSSHPGVCGSSGISACLLAAALLAVGGCADPGGSAVAPSTSGPVPVSPAIELTATTGFAPSPAHADAWASAQAGWSAEASAAGLAVSAGGARASFATVAAPAEAHLEGRTVVIARGDMTEEFEAREGGVEQRWRFARAPADGTVRVRVAVEGLRYAGESPAGLRFADAATGASLRYGHATWVDAGGRRTAVPARWTGATIELAVPDEVVAASSFPAALDPVIGPEFPVEPGGAMAAGSTVVNQPRVSAMGATSLAVWPDLRGGVYTVRARRLDATGAPLGADDIVVPEGPYFVSVAAGASAWLVVWTSGLGVRALRVSAAGAVLDATPLTLNMSIEPGESPAVAWDGAQWLVTWADRRAMAATGTDVYGARVAADGRVLDPAGLAIGTLAGDARSIAVAANAGGAVVAWVDPAVQDVRWARVGRDGVTRDPGGVRTSAIARDRQAPAVATDGTNFLVAWADMTSGGSLTQGTYGLRIGAAGALDAAPRALNGYTRLVTLTFGGGNYLTSSAGFDTGVIYTQRVSPAGVALDAMPRTVAVGAVPQTLSIAPTSAGFMALIATRSSGSLYALRAVPLGADGTTPGAPQPVVVVREAQTRPRASFGGREFLVTWAVPTASGTFGARVSRAGALLDSPARQLLPRATTFTGNGATGYYAIWAEYRMFDTGYAYLQGVPLGVDLSVGATTTVGMFEATRSPLDLDLRGGPAGFVAGWIISGAAFDPLTVATVPAAGAVGGLGVTTPAHNNGLPHPALAVGRDEMLVVWPHTEMVSLTYTCTLLAQRLTPQADRIDATPIQVYARTGPSTCDVGAPKAAWGGAGWIVVWGEGSGGARRLSAVRLASDGRVLDPTPLPIVAATLGSDRFEVAYDGTDYVTVWSDTRGGGDVYGARVSASGVVRDPGGFAIATGPGAEVEPSVATDGAGQSLVAYARNDTSGISRVFARVVGFSASDAGVLDASADASRDVTDIGSDTGVDGGAPDVTIDVTAPTDLGRDAGMAPDVAVDAPPYDVALADASTEDVAADVSTEDIARDVAAEDIARDVAVEDVAAADVAAEDVTAADVTAADVTAEDVTAADVTADGGAPPPANDACGVQCGVGAAPTRTPTGWLTGLAVALAAGRRRRRAPPPRSGLTA